MPIPEMPVKWARILECTRNLYPPLVPPTPGHPARFLNTQRPTGRHHPHHVVRLLHPPQIVRHPLHHALNRMTILDIHPINVEERLHRLPRNTLRPVLPLFYESATVDPHLLQIDDGLQDAEARIKDHVSSRVVVRPKHPQQKSSGLPVSSEFPRNLWGGILSLDKFDRKQNVRQGTACSMVFVTKRMWLAGAKDPSRTRPPLMPNRHALVEAYHPPGKEDVGHVGVPLLDHLPDLPKLIDERWCSDVRERQVPLD